MRLRKRYQEKEVLNAFMPDGSPAYDQTRQQWRTGKLSYQATAANRFIGFQQWGTQVRTEQDERSPLL